MCFTTHYKTRFNHSIKLDLHMKKSELITQIQKIPGVVTVEGIHISPDEPDELLCLITFLPVDIPEQLTIQDNIQKLQHIP